MPDQLDGVELRALHDKVLWSNTLYFETSVAFLYSDIFSVYISETLAEPSLHATQLKLKRARLADDLNEKIAQRPGPMELVEKNILPVDPTVNEDITGKQKKGKCHG